MQGVTCGKFEERDIYMELIQQFPLKPIKNDSELDDATAMLDSLLECGELTVEAEQYAEVLEGLIEKYEREYHAIPPVPDSELLRHLIDAKDISQVDVARATGIVESTISAVLAGKRSLRREHIGKLARYFNVPIDTFSFDE
jgi:HTH-type transcriptional regulator/antitoxin HigA